MHGLSLLLMACASAPEAMPEGVVPPPPDFTLSVGNVVAGQFVTFAVDGAPANTTLRLVYGKGGLGVGPCPGILQGECVGVRSRARLLPMVIQTDGAGAGEVTVPVATALTGRYLALQAVDITGPSFSNPVGRFVGSVASPNHPTADTDGDGWSIQQGDCADFLASVNPSVVDTVGDGYDWNCDDADGDDGDHDDVEDMFSGGADCQDDDPGTIACPESDVASFVDTLGDDIPGMWPAVYLVDATAADDVQLSCSACPTCTVRSWSFASMGYSQAAINEIALYLSSKEALIQDDIMQWGSGTVNCFGTPLYPRYNFLYWNTSTGVAHLDFAETANDCSMTMWNVMGPRDADGAEGNLCASGVVGGTGQLQVSGEWFEVRLINPR